MAHADVTRKRDYERRRYHEKRSDHATRVTLLVKDSRKRAKKAGLSFKLSKAWVDRIKKQTACAVTGIMFDLSKRPGATNPLAPSLDRVDSAKGYTDKNTRLVIHFVNNAKNDLSDEQFRTLILVAASNMRH